MGNNKKIGLNRFGIKNLGTKKSYLPKIGDKPLVVINKLDNKKPGVKKNLGVVNKSFVKRVVVAKQVKKLDPKKKVKVVIKFDSKIFQKYKKQIQCYQLFSEKLVKKNKLFFFWIFNVMHIPKYTLLRLNPGLPKAKVARYTRRTAPSLNLRLYSLYVAILRDGNAIRAQNIITKVIVLLTENCVEKSGCKVLNNTLRLLEPALGILKYRRGRNFYQMPVPLWPQRKKFLAAKFLVKGARQRQRLYRTSFLVALFYEVIEVYNRKVDSFTLKIFKRYRKRLLKLESQIWRAKKRKF